MKYFILFPILCYFYAFPENIYIINSLKERAETHFKNGNIKEALLVYKDLVDVHKSKEGSVLINYAHLLLLSHDSLSARGVYTKVIKHAKNNTVRARALTQAALIEYKFNKNKEEAITLLQRALIEDDANSAARHNLFILLQLKKEGDNANEKENNNTHHTQKTSGGNQEKEMESNIMEVNSDQNNTDTNAEELEASNFQNLNLSIDKARQILEVMQKNEVQYIQQLKRREDEPEQEDVNKPDW
jgi:tetratricopeptide (TPR) repeat protein